MFTSAPVPFVNATFAYATFVHSTSVCATFVTATFVQGHLVVYNCSLSKVLNILAVFVPVKTKKSNFKLATEPNKN